MTKNVLKEGRDKVRAALAPCPYPKPACFCRGGLPARLFSEWVVRPTKRVVDLVRDVHPQAKIIGFPRAATLPGYLQYADETGVDAVSLDTGAPIDWIAKELPAGIAIQGNLVRLSRRAQEMP